MKYPKKFPPAMRTTKRYLTYEIISESDIKFEDFQNALNDSAINFLGEFLFSKSEMKLIYNLCSDKKGVIECKNTYLEHIRAAISMISIIGETRAIVKIEGVTGTIKSAKSKYIEVKNVGSDRI